MDIRIKNYKPLKENSTEAKEEALKEKIRRAGKIFRDPDTSKEEKAKVEADIKSYKKELDSLKEEMDLDRTWNDVFGDRADKLLAKQKGFAGNDPVLMKARAAKDKHKKDLEAEKMRDKRWGKTDRERQQYRWGLQDELDDLKAQQKQMYIDMEQEAEPEGGEIADRYGSDLNDIEAKIDIITAELDEMDLFESVNESKYRVEYTTQDGEKAKSRVYNSEEEADKKEADLVNSGIKQAKVVKVEESINEGKFPKSFTIKDTLHYTPVIDGKPKKLLKGTYFLRTDKGDTAVYFNQAFKSEVEIDKDDIINFERLKSHFKIDESNWEKKLSKKAVWVDDNLIKKFKDTLGNDQWRYFIKTLDKAEKGLELSQTEEQVVKYFNMVKANWDDAIAKGMSPDEISLNPNKSINEGTWSSGTYNEIGRFLQDIRNIKDKYYDIVGSDDVYDGLDRAEEAAREMMINAPENRSDVEEGTCGYDTNVKNGKKNKIPGGKKGLAEKIKSIIKNIS